MLSTIYTLYGKRQRYKPNGNYFGILTEEKHITSKQYMSTDLDVVILGADECDEQIYVDAVHESMPQVPNFCYVSQQSHHVSHQFLFGRKQLNKNIRWLHSV